jgi:hypothetical protein
VTVFLWAAVLEHKVTRLVQQREERKMRNRQQQLLATFGVALLLAGCVTGGADRGASEGGAAGNAAPPKCRKWVSVSSTNDEHLQLGERFRISGPTNDGDYRLRPIGGGHQVLPKDHPVVESSNAFEGEIEIQGGPHGDVKLHFYTIEMEFDSEGCPSRLILETMVHAGDPGHAAHGGDAVMD